MATREANRAYSRRYRARHPERIRKAVRKWNEGNGPRGLNVEVARAASRAWKLANPERVRELDARKRARKAKATIGKITPRDVSRLVRRHRGLCAYCKKTPWLHLDHVVPLSRGGAHSIGNLLPACAPCNLSKHAKLLVEWRPHG